MMRQLITAILLLHFVVLRGGEAQMESSATTARPVTTTRPPTSTSRTETTTARPVTTTRPPTTTTFPTWYPSTIALTTTARPVTTTRPLTTTTFPTWDPTTPTTTTPTTTPFHPIIQFVEAHIQNSAYTFVRVDEYDRISFHCYANGGQGYNNYIWERRDYGNPTWHYFAEGQFITFTAYVGVYRCMAKNFYMQVASRNEIGVDIACLDTNDISV